MPKGFTLFNNAPIWTIIDLSLCLQHKSNFIKTIEPELNCIALIMLRGKNEDLLGLNNGGKVSLNQLKSVHVFTLSR
jgi:hypothetical protein